MTNTWRSLCPTPYLSSLGTLCGAWHRWKPRECRVTTSVLGRRWVRAFVSGPCPGLHSSRQLALYDFGVSAVEESERPKSNIKAESYASLASEVYTRVRDLLEGLLDVLLKAFLPGFKLCLGP